MSERTMGLMVHPICGELVIVRQRDSPDFISPCWAEPGHEGPHTIILPPEPRPVEAEEPQP